MRGGWNPKCRLGCRLQVPKSMIMMGRKTGNLPLFYPWVLTANYRWKKKLYLRHYSGLPGRLANRSEHVQLEFVKNGRRVEKSTSVELRSKNRERGGENFERVGE